MYYPHVRLAMPGIRIRRIDGCGVADGLVCVLMENTAAIAVCPVVSGLSMRVLCSWGTVIGKGRGAFAATDVDQAEVWDLMMNSTLCRHARASSGALIRLQDVLGQAVTVAATALRYYRGMSASGDEVPEALESVVVELAGMRGKHQNTAVYAVYYSRVWTPVVVKPRENSHKLGFCFSLSCMTQPYGCVRAKRVNAERNIDAVDFSAAGAAWMEQKQFDNDCIYMSDEEEAGPQTGDAVTAARQGPALPPSSSTRVATSHPLLRQRSTRQVRRTPTACYPSSLWVSIASPVTRGLRPIRSRICDRVSFRLSMRSRLGMFAPGHAQTLTLYHLTVYKTVSSRLPLK